LWLSLGKNLVHGAREFQLTRHPQPEFVAFREDVDLHELARLAAAVDG